MEHAYFEPLILGVILFNTSLIALDDQQAPHTRILTLILILTLTLTQTRTLAPTLTPTLTLILALAPTLTPSLTQTLSNQVGPSERVWLTRLNLLCTSIFVLEATFKLIGYGCSEYFLSGWHKFDFTVVVLALPDMLDAIGLDAILPPSVFPTNLLRILRIARVARVLRLIKSSKGLQ